MRVKTFEDYEVFEDGRIWSEKSKKFLRIGKNKDGYSIVKLSRDGNVYNKKVHRLVADAFVYNDNPEHKTQVNHINENKSDNHADNLEWVTPSENINYGSRNKKVADKLSKPVIISKGNFIHEYESISEASRKLGLDLGNLSKVLNGKLNTTGGYRAKYKEKR